MDPEKILKFVAENIAEFFEVMIKTLVNPVAHFQPLSTAPASVGATEGNQGKPRWFNPKLFAFAGVSIIIGTIIIRLIPASRDEAEFVRRDPPELLATVVITLVIWFAYGTGIYLLCKILHGKGTYAETMAVSIQLIATLFVVSSTLTLGLATLDIQPSTDISGSRLLLDRPALFFFFCIEALLLAVYFPLALKRIHAFGWARQACISVVPLLTMWGGIRFFNVFSIPTAW